MLHHLLVNIQLASSIVTEQWHQYTIRNNCIAQWFLRTMSPKQTLVAWCFFSIMQCEKVRLHVRELDSMEICRCPKWSILCRNIVQWVEVLIQLTELWKGLISAKRSCTCYRNLHINQLWKRMLNWILYDIHIFIFKVDNIWADHIPIAPESRAQPINGGMVVVWLYFTSLEYRKEREGAELLGW